MQIDTLTRDGDELLGPFNPHDRGEKKVALFSTSARCGPFARSPLAISTCWRPSSVRSSRKHSRFFPMRRVCDTGFKVGRTRGH